MTLAKIENGVLRYAPKVITVDRRKVFNPLEEQLKELGYKEVVTLDAPEAKEGYHLINTYTEKETTIEVGWDYEEDAKSPSDLDEFIAVLKGDKTTYD